MLTTPLDALNEPGGVAVLPSEEIVVVVDTGNYRIKAFNMLHRAEAAGASSAVVMPAIPNNNEDRRKNPHGEAERERQNRV